MYQSGKPPSVGRQDFAATSIEKIDPAVGEQLLSGARKTPKKPPADRQTREKTGTVAIAPAARRVRDLGREDVEAREQSCWRSERKNIIGGVQAGKVTTSTTRYSHVAVRSSPLGEVVFTEAPVPTDFESPQFLAQDHL